MKFEINDIAYCLTQPSMFPHLTKRKGYEVLDLDIDSAGRNRIKIMGNRGLFFWFPESIFSKEKQPEFTEIITKKFDATIRSENDCIRITVVFENGEKGWLKGMSSEYLTKLAKIDMFYTHVKDTYIFDVMSKENIRYLVLDLDLENKLMDALNPFE